MAILDESRRTKKLSEKQSREDDFVRAKRGKADRIVRNITMGTAVVVLIGSLGVIVWYLFSEVRNEIEYNKYSSMYDNMVVVSGSSPDGESSVSADSEVYVPKELLPMAKELLAVNPDTVGYIKIDNTKISYPVVLRKDDMNEYYLTHSFEGATSRAGAIFADYRTTLTDRKRSKNVILYGHNEASNKMFGDLDDYKNNGGDRWSSSALQFYKENPTITFDTNYEQDTYKIFAIFVTAVLPEQDSQNEIFDYQNYIDMDQARYNKFIGEVNLRNKLITEVDVNYGDDLLTLSTCSNEADDMRLVIFARKLRDDESSAVNTENAAFSDTALEPDWGTIYGKD